MTEALSLAESLALVVARPAELGPGIEDFRSEILNPSDRNDNFVEPYLLRPSPIPGGVSEELLLGQMSRLIAACGDNADNRGKNYVELLNSMNGDPLALAALLVFPDKKDLREELIATMRLPGSFGQPIDKDFLIVSPKGEDKKNLLLFALVKMAQDRQIAPEPETDSGEQGLPKWLIEGRDEARFRALAEEEKVESTRPKAPRW